MNAPMPLTDGLAHRLKQALACGLLATLPALAAPPQKAAPAQPAGPLKLHVPSPDWRDQVLYFLLTDRFADGNPANNDQGAGEYQPGTAGYYQGGDLQGVIDRLDYIRGLGATGVWITPPVANLWVDPQVQYTGYHGYWAENFKQVDKHLGTLADYKRLSHALHSQGLVLVQDIVVNHTGNYFHYRDGWDASDPTRFYERNTAARPHPAPTQAPFHLNDPRRAADRAAGIYHWTPPVADYKVPLQERTFQMGGLDDLATTNPRVRRALRDSFGYWVREVGVDAFRIDTAFYVEPDFFGDFMHSRDARAPGMAEVARRTGRQDFLAFGEGFAMDKPFDDTQARKIERYMTGGRGQPLLPGMLNFPLYGALGDVFARGRPPAELGHRIAAVPRIHARPHRMPSFIDNHDVDRFLAGGSEPALRQALLALMTLPGIPVIYYGTEQGFTLQRASMFAAGWGSGGRDRFDTAHPLYRAIASMTALRREHRLFSRGLPEMLHAEGAAPGALAWRTTHEGAAALVVFNTADTEVLLDNLAPGGAPGARLQPLYGLDGLPPALQLGADGRTSLRLPPRAGWVWALPPSPASALAAPTQPPPQSGPQAAAQASSPSAAAAPVLDPLPAAAVKGDFTVTGRAPGAGPLRLVVDGQLATAATVQPGADGRWQALLDTSALVDPQVRHRLVVLDEASGQASASQGFRVEREWQLLADVADAAGDDQGPGGSGLRYTYPSDASFAGRQMDLRRVQVWGSGGALRVVLTMPEISQVWAPANGFDHVAFTLFIALPGQAGGTEVMPFQDGRAPLAWHRRLRAHGWSNALFSDLGAQAQADGAAVVPSAQIAVDVAARSVSFTLPAKALRGADGRAPASLSGLRLYVTTWDYDGGYRALGPQAKPFAMGGGRPGLDPKVMDDLPVITLP